MKILVIEDDKSISDIISLSLTGQSHIVDVVDNGTEGSFMGRTYEYDTIILDHALPGKNGLTVCKDIRGSGKTTPIIFVSMTGDTDTKVLALDSGADDYMTKPFSPSELHSRIKAIRRRNPLVSDVELKVHDLTLDLRTRQAQRKNKRILLTQKEFALLEYMIRHKGIVLSRAMIMEHVWTADSDPFSNTIEAHISNLRKKIHIDKQPDLIANITGHGYIIDEPNKLSSYRR